MHDIEYIRNNPEKFAKEIQSRGIKDFTVHEILKIDCQKRHLTTKLQALHKQRNQITEEIKILKMNHACIQHKILLSKEITNKIDKIVLKEQQNREQLLKIVSHLPNIPLRDVPIGDHDNDNIEIKKDEEHKRIFDFIPQSHFYLGQKLNLMDFAQTAKISGSRFVILKGQLAKLARVLTHFMLEMHVNQFGYTEIYHPSLVKSNAMYNVGQLPKFSDDSYCTKNELRLIPTSEVVLTNLVSDKILKEEELPIRVTAYSECFRKEAGNAGVDNIGMIRQHQFGKVELVSITNQEESNNELHRIISIVETVLKTLELPYRIMLLCSMNMSFAAQKAYDIEVWMPYQKTYREISSCSNCGAFQARRMNTKYSMLYNKQVKKYVHTLNGSAVAIGRMIIAIMENYQNSDGSITIPKILRPFLGNSSTINI
ncbi:serine--tRNA ligase [Wolbachia endosymbiont of Howardula sp.]|uniref:serine--tRNA ligase n=1 Tax=Wolbachia endosymbiont of Howardula sp. TaxID=2916816 RepID=UPI00217CC228|nr:serine--tRNA ligase [Wolbachia endosymbiont of Howardula sp.]UWI83409.1 serine--tRNA ligase [Wolbachia endosymbiont of Howardula sp.]